MSRPTHLLRHEHRVIEQAMRALEGMCLRILAGGDAPSEELSKLLDFIRNYEDRFHHAKAALEIGIKPAPVTQLAKPRPLRTSASMPNRS